MVNRSDGALMRAVSGGDNGALGELFRIHHQRVYSLCFRITGDRMAADDLVQECFLRVMRYRRKFDGRSTISTWLYRIARNVCMDHLTHGARRSKIERTATEEMVRGGEAGTKNEDPRVERLERALALLRQEEREMLVLSRYHDLPYAEIATVCDCTVGAVKVRIHRAMKELTRLVKEME